MGPGAVKWIDKLSEAGQSWWQALPLGPTGYGDSPYQSLSSFAGNGLLISPDWLIEDGLLRGKRMRAAFVSSGGGGLCGGDHVQAPIAREAWSQFPDCPPSGVCALPLNSSVTSRRIGSRITRSFES